VPSTLNSLVQKYQIGTHLSAVLDKNWSQLYFVKTLFKNFSAEIKVHKIGPWSFGARGFHGESSEMDLEIFFEFFRLDSEAELDMAGLWSADKALQYERNEFLHWSLG
jgi:hypothetical protein